MPSTPSTRTGARSDAYGTLWGLAEAGNSGGAYARADGRNVVRMANLSRHSIYAGERDGTMAMGIVKAILHVLSGGVQEISCDTDAATGRVSIASGSQPGLVYRMSWDDRDATVAFGGFVNGPTYQVAIVGLVMVLCQSIMRTARDTEVAERWWGLVSAMGGSGPWSDDVVAGRCQDTPANTRVRDHIEGLADALWLALAYSLPDTTERRRAVVVEEMPLTGAQGTAVGIAPLTLLTVPSTGAGVLVAPDIAGGSPLAAPGAVGSPAGTDAAPRPGRDGRTSRRGLVDTALDVPGLADQSPVPVAPPAPAREAVVAALYHQTTAEMAAALRAARRQLGGNAGEEGALRVVLSIQDGPVASGDRDALRTAVDALRRDGAIVLSLCVGSPERVPWLVEAFGPEWTVAAPSGASPVGGGQASSVDGLGHRARSSHEQERP